MTRITEIDDLMFPVELRAVYTDIEVNGNTKIIKVPNSRTIVDKHSGRPLGIVSNNYKLITNEEAIKLGKQCCSELIGTREAANIEIFQVDAPSTASFCHIDLIHKSYVMNLWDGTTQAETFVPYVRLTNSYNRSRALKFDIGLCRELCLNGIIFESETIEFKFNHVNNKTTDDISFALKNGKLKSLFEKFVSYADKLKNHTLSRKNAIKIIYALFNIKDITEIDFDESKEDLSEYNKLLKTLETKLDKYISELGANSYALFNVITDIASHSLENRYFRRDMNSMQRLAGNWINSFQKEIERKDFSTDTYIQALKESPRKTLHLPTNRYTIGA